MTRLRLLSSRYVVSLLVLSICVGFIGASLCEQPAFAKTKKGNVFPVLEEEMVQAPAFEDDLPVHDDGLTPEPTNNHLEEKSLLNTRSQFNQFKTKKALPETADPETADINPMVSEKIEHKKAETQKPVHKKTTGKKNATAQEPQPTYHIDEGKLTTQTRKDIERLTQALNEQSQTVFNELKDDQELASKDIAMLWQAAVERSGTIRYAIEKLSRKDATGKAVSGDGLTKRLLQSAARVGGVAGTIWTGTPAGILGGNIVEQLMASTPTDPSQMRITDADMLILAKEVDALQSQVIETYYQYRQAEERWKLAQEASTTLAKQYDRHQNAKSKRSGVDQALKPLMDSMIQSAEQEENNHKQSFVNARNSLGLLVGGDALFALEQARQQESTSSSSALLP